MQGQDQGEITGEPTEAVEQSPGEEQTVQTQAVVPSTAPEAAAREFDWTAIGVVLLIAALFALAARFSPQPATSLTPAAVLSATGCGLLVTAMRKLRTSYRPGLFEAAVGGFFLAIFQFMAAITYPNVLYALGQAYDERLGFLSTWGLVAVFSIVFSMVGAALGHLVFAPLRPLPGDQPPPGSEASSTQRSVASYFIAILLLGLAPSLVGFLFSAAFDHLLQANLFLPGPYPTLRLLSAMLPWQVPIPFNLNSNIPGSSIFLLWELWRIPLFLGNPGMFDIQALEPYVFNAAALGFLLLTMREKSSNNISRPVSLSWPIYMLLTIALGLVLVLPADLWIDRGLQGLLQGQIVAVPIRTLYILDRTTFTLNLITGPLACVAIGVLLRLVSKQRAHV